LELLFHGVFESDRTGENVVKRWNRSVHPFTRIEFLVLVAIASIASTIVLPLFIHMSAKMRLLACSDSLLQLSRANILYASDYGCYSPAATSDGRRWHGKKMENGNYAAINPSEGFLSPFLRGVQPPLECPEMRSRLEDPPPPSAEKGGFGYGYNLNIGSLRCEPGHDYWDPACESSGIKRNTVRNPGRTVVFADTGCRVNGVGESFIGGTLAEHAFAVSFHTLNRGYPLGGVNDPTLHFRHSGNVNIVWADGHVTQEPMIYSKGDWKQYGFGFIGTPNETFFDP
jgi:prepilin-type processing-associated H-X9-DG protein